MKKAFATFCVFTALTTTAFANSPFCRIVTADENITTAALFDKGYQNIDIQDARPGDYLEEARIISAKDSWFFDSCDTKLKINQTIYQYDENLDLKLVSSKILYATAQGKYLGCPGSYQRTLAAAEVRGRKMPKCPTF